MSNSRLISFNVLSDATAADMKELAAYTRMKQAYVNSRINNYDPRTVAKREKLKWTVGTVKRWVPRLIERGLARMEGNDLVLISKLELARRHLGKTGKIAYIKTETDDVLTELYAWSLTNHLSRMLHRKVGTLAQSKTMVKKLYKIYRGQPLSISSYGLAKLWDVSKSTANRISALLARSGLFLKESFEKEILTLCTASNWQKREHWWSFDVPYSSCYWYKGIVFYKKASQYSSLLDNKYWR